MPALNPAIYYENEENHGSYAFIGIEELVNNFIQNYTGDSSLIGQVPRHKVVYQVKQAVREFNYGMLNRVRAVELELSENLNIILPNDFVSYVRISWINPETGEIMPMAINPRTPLSISHLQDNNAGILFDNNGDILIGTSIAEHITNNVPPNEIAENLRSTYPNCRCYCFGTIWNLDTSRNYNGTFNIDEGRIHFSSDNLTRVILLEYISDGLELQESQIRVHKFAEDAVYAYVHYRLSNNSIRVAEYDRRRLKKEYDTLVRNAKVRLLNIKPQGVINQLGGLNQWVK